MNGATLLHAATQQVSALPAPSGPIRAAVAPRTTGPGAPKGDLRQAHLIWLAKRLRRMSARPARQLESRPMKSIYIDLLGYLAATLTTVALVPQAILTWRTRSAHGISLGMYCIFVSGVTGWLFYGLLISAWPVVAANAVTLLLAGFILGMKIRFG